MPVNLFGVTLPLLAMTLSIDNLCNGFTCPLCGCIFDKIGRENTMFIIFLREGHRAARAMEFGRDPYLFMLFAAMTFLCWGEIFSIFPATCADTFGSKYAAANAGTLYTRSTRQKARRRCWCRSHRCSRRSGFVENAVFIAAAVTSIVAGLCAKFVLAPMRRRWIENTVTQTAAQSSIDASFQSGWTDAPSRPSVQ